MHRGPRGLAIAEVAGFTEVHEALDADRRERFGYRPEAKAVTDAIEAGDPDRALARVDGDPRLLHAVDEGGNAPIHLAVMMRQLETIRELASRGANLDHTRFNGARPVDLVNGDYWFSHRVKLPEAIQVGPALTSFRHAVVRLC